MSWQVLESDEITEESLRLFKLLEPKVDLVVSIHTFYDKATLYRNINVKESTLTLAHYAVSSIHFVNVYCQGKPKMGMFVLFQIVGLESNDRSKFSRVFKAARANNLNVEILPTEHACSTFNFLNAEGR